MASKRRLRRKLRRKSCEGKVKLSESVARFIATKETKLGNWMLPYRCRFCGGWHIGHPNYECRSRCRNGSAGEEAQRMFDLYNGYNRA